jgi:hypothetical protein
MLASMTYWCHLSSRLSHIRVSAGVRAPGGQCQQFGGQIIGAWLGFLGQRVTQKNSRTSTSADRP